MAHTKQLFLLLCLLLMTANSAAERLMIKLIDHTLPIHVNHPQIPILQHQTSSKNYSLVELPDALSIDEKIRIRKQLTDNPNVKWIERDTKIQLSQSTPNDEFHYVQTPWQTSIHLPEAWEHQAHCQNTIIAIIDSGLDIQHPDLSDNVWINPGEIPDNGIDDDENGKIDDVSGWNTINNNPLVNDLYGHGTHVAGLVAATGNNHIGVTGTCWQANILPIKFLDRYGSGFLSHAVDAVQYVMDLKAQYPEYHFIVNNSWAAIHNTALEEIIDQASSQGILFVNAAGNSGDNIDNRAVYPASFSAQSLSSITVANLDTTDPNTPFKLSTTSNHGLSHVTLAAPGTDIYSTWPSSLTSDEPAYHFKSGTSMATPMVSGIAALLWQQNPALNSTEIRAIISNNTQYLASLNGFTSTSGYIDAYRTLIHNDLKTGLGYVSTASQMELHGVNLDQLSQLTLNNTPLPFIVTDNSHLSFSAADQLKCGYLQGETSQGLTNRLYLDWTPSPPTDLQLTPIDNHYVLAWNTDPNVETITLLKASKDGIFEELDTIDNDTQTTTLSQLLPSDQITLLSHFDCPSPQETLTTKSSEPSDTLTIGDYSLPSWQTKSFSSAVVSQDYHSLFSVTGAHTLEVDLSQVTESPCFPDGLTLTEEAITGQPVKQQHCHFELVATNKNQLSSRQLFTINTTDRPPYALSHDDIEFSLETALPILGATLNKVTDNRWRMDLFTDAAQAINEIAMTLHSPQLTLIAASQLIDNEYQAITLKSSRSLEWYIEQENDSASQKDYETHSIYLTLSSSNNSLNDGSNAKDNRCFIASSIYQNRNAQEVQQLREIRDLLINEVPILEPLIHYYYQASPTWVAWMQSNPYAYLVEYPIKSWLDQIIWLNKRLSDSDNKDLNRDQ